MWLNCFRHSLRSHSQSIVILLLGVIVSDETSLNFGCSTRLLYTQGFGLVETFVVLVNQPCISVSSRTALRQPLTKSYIIPTVGLNPYLLFNIRTSLVSLALLMLGSCSARQDFICWCTYVVAVLDIFAQRPVDTKNQTHVIRSPT